MRFAELLQLILLAIGPGGVRSIGGYEFYFPSSELKLTHEACAHYCPYPGMVGKGDSAGSPGTGPHLAAQRARA